MLRGEGFIPVLDLRMFTSSTSSRARVSRSSSRRVGVQYAKAKGYEVEFFAEDAGRADLQFLAKFTEAVIAAGADVVKYSGHYRVLSATSIW